MLTDSKIPVPRPQRSADDLRAHAEHLDRLGITLIADVLDADDLAEARRLLDPIYDGYDPERDSLGRVEGYHFAANLVDKAPFFQDVFLREPVYGLVRHILGDDGNLSSLNSLEPRRDNPQQGLHRDGGFPSGASLNTWWVIDDMDADNGATRVVPGTHRTDDEPAACEADAVQLVASAGTVAVIDARLVHGAGVNREGRRRRLLHAYWVRAGLPQQTEQRRYLSAQEQARLDARTRAVLRI